MNLDFRCELCKYILEKDVQDMGCVIVCPECGGIMIAMWPSPVVSVKRGRCGNAADKYTGGKE